MNDRLHACAEDAAVDGDDEITIVTCLPLFFHFLSTSYFFLKLHLLHIYFHFCSLSHSFLNYIHAAPSIITAGFFYSTLSLALLFFPSILGQRGEPGTGPPPFEQPPGRGLGPQTASRSVYRDLCPGHWQHAAQSVPRGLVSSRLPIPSGATATICDHLPPGGSWGRKDTGRIRWQDLAPAPQQCHHALYPLQTQGTQRGALSPESGQDTHANVLPASARRTHPRNE